MKKIKPGIYPWIPNYKYHTGPGVSNSDLKLLYTKSPAHLKWKKDHPTEPTDAMNVGQLFHTMTLEPHKEKDRFVYFPAGMARRSKAEKELWADLEGTGKILVREEKRQDVIEMVKSVNDHPMANVLLNNDKAIYEHSAYYEDDETKMLCKIRPDILIEDLDLGGEEMFNAVVDLKKAADADFFGFRRACGNYFYDMQSGMYLTGASKALKKDFNLFIFIVVEDTPPYACAVYLADSEFVEKGKELYRNCLNKYAYCFNNNLWPAYSEDLQTMELPSWRL
jgi:exodeoxyribonuclease VIII